jgi:Na+/alanine symporter
MIEQFSLLIQDKTISATERIITGFSDLAWGTPLLVLLPGGSLFFLFYSRMLPSCIFATPSPSFRGGMMITLTAYAMMAFPTTISALLLSPQVIRATRDYFNRLKCDPTHGKG